MLNYMNFSFDLNKHFVPSVVQYKKLNGYKNKSSSYIHFQDNFLGFSLECLYVKFMIWKLKLIFKFYLQA